MRREKSTYNKNYITYRDTIRAYQDNNIEDIREYRKLYMREYNKKNKDILYSRCLLSNLKQIIKEKRTPSSRYIKRFNRETGVSISEFLNYLGAKNVCKWLRGDLEIDHIVCFSKLKQLDLISGANYYKNIQLVEQKENREFINQMFGKVNSNELSEILSGIVQIKLKS